jgi:hypothetical protein
MKNYLQILTALLVVFFTISCAKHDEGEPMPVCNAGKLKSLPNHSGVGRHDEFFYDETGRIIQVRRSDGQKVGFADFQYDDFEKTATVVFSGDLFINDVVLLSFDENWNLVKIGTEYPSFIYDAEGFLIEGETVTYENGVLKFHFKFFYNWVDGNLVEILRKNMLDGSESWVFRYTYLDEPNVNHLPLVRVFSNYHYDFFLHYLRPVKNLISQRNPGYIDYQYIFDDSGNVAQLDWLSSEGDLITSRKYIYYCK